MRSTVSRLIVSGGAVFAVALAAQGQVTFYTGTSRIVNSDGSLPFSDITQNGQTLVNYQSAGLRVHVNDFAFVFTPCGFNNPNVYYPNGGVGERINVTKVNGGDFAILETQVSHGFGGCTIFMWASAYNNGNLIAHFDADVQGGTLIGFEGVFDELVIGSYQNAQVRDTHDELALNAIALDNMQHGTGQSRYTCATSGPCPGTKTIAWTGAEPNRQQGIVFASSQGNFIIPGGVCQGTQLGLSSQNIQLVNTIPTGPNGTGQVNGQAGPGACGGFIQLITVPSCATSNVAPI